MGDRVLLPVNCLPAQGQSLWYGSVAITAPIFAFTIWNCCHYTEYNHYIQGGPCFYCGRGILG